MKKRFLAIIAIAFCMRLGALASPTSGENIWHIMAVAGTQIDELSVNIPTCCAATFTAMQEVQNDISGQLALTSSKIDNIAASQIDNFAATFTVLDQISKEVLATMTQIEAAAGEIESALSSIDQLFVAHFNTSNSKLDSCCLSMNSAIDGVIENTQAHFLTTFTMLNSQESLQNTLQSSIDQCCYSLNSKIAVLNESFTQSFAQTFTVFPAIANQAATVESKIDRCCATVNSAIDTLSSVVVTDFAGTFTALATISCASGGCAAPTQVTGSTTISVPGKYCLAGNIAATIVISGVGIVFDLSGRTLLGTLEIQGSSNDITIQNGEINAPAPTANSQPSCFIIDAGAQNISIRNVSIISADTTTNNIAGRSAVSNSGTNVTFEKCVIQGGMGGSGSAGNNGGTVLPGTGGAGGFGLTNNGANLIMNDSMIVGGSGGSGINGPDGQMAIGFVNGGAGGNGGIGAVALNNTGNNMTLTRCTIQAGAGGSGGTGGLSTIFLVGMTLLRGVGGAGGTSGIGGNALYNNATQINVIDSIIIAGNGGNGGIGGTSGISGTAAGGNGAAGSNGGAGIFSDTNSTNAQYVKCIIRAGAGGPGGRGGDVGAGAVVNNGANAGNGGAGGNGITENGANNQYLRCEIFAGDAGTGGGAGNGLPQVQAGTAGVGGNGGSGIVCNASNIVIINGVIQGGNGANGGDGGTAQVPPAAANGSGGNGGNGGLGVNFASGSANVLRNVAINKTGVGGIGGAGGTFPGEPVGPVGATGNGGDAVSINAATTNTEVNNCSISNTGSGTLGGRAIVDNSATFSTTIYSNFAYNINFSSGYAAYFLQTGNAIDSPTGTAYAAGSDRLSNVHKP